MNDFFSLDYQGESFILFGLAHLVALLLVLLANLWLFRTRQRINLVARRRIRFFLAAALLLNEAGWHLWHLSHGVWTVQTMLPLHLCNLLVFWSVVMLFTRSYFLYEFAYFLGIGGAIQALLTPGLNQFGFPHFLFFQSFISHGSIVTAAVYMTVVEGYRPSWHSFVKVVIWTNLYMAVIFVVNLFLGSNYLFIARKPAAPTLIDLLGPWPWYILALEFIGLAVFLLLYLPYAVKDARQQSH